MAGNRAITLDAFKELIKELKVELKSDISSVTVDVKADMASIKDDVMNIKTVRSCGFEVDFVFLSPYFYLSVCIWLYSVIIVDKIIF